MYVDANKTILTDCDGVLLDWNYSFNRWMYRHGYKLKVLGSYCASESYGLSMDDGQRLVRMFNESATIRCMPPLRDSIKYVKKIHEELGYVFHAITSLSDDEYAQHLRTKNLRETFGDTVFETFTYLGCGEDKDDALEPYRNSGCIWVEDRPENAQLGIELGLDTILMRHDYNNDHSINAKEVNSWKEIYNHLTGY